MDEDLAKLVLILASRSVLSILESLSEDTFEDDLHPLLPAASFKDCLIFSLYLSV